MNATATIAASPRGPSVAAFFDFDGTLIDGFSAFAFLADRAARSDLPLEESLALVLTSIEASRGRTDFDTFMRRGCHPFRGQDAGSLDALGDGLYDTRLAKAVFPEAAQVVRAHLERGHTVALATSALPFQVEPAARRLGIEHLLCTRLEVRDGVCTGRIDGPVVWGPGKAAAVRAFSASHDIELHESFGYGNGDEDLDFLRAVGRPNPVNPKPELERVARAEGWPIHRFAQASKPGLATRLGRLARGLGGEAIKALGPG